MNKSKKGSGGNKGKKKGGKNKRKGKGRSPQKHQKQQQQQHQRPSNSSNSKSNSISNSNSNCNSPSNKNNKNNMTKSESRVEAPILPLTPIHSLSQSPARSAAPEPWWSISNSPPNSRLLNGDEAMEGQQDLEYASVNAGPFILILNNKNNKNNKNKNKNTNDQSGSTRAVKEISNLPAKVEIEFKDYKKSLEKYLQDKFTHDISKLIENKEKEKEKKKKEIDKEKSERKGRGKDADSTFEIVLPAIVKREIIESLSDLFKSQGVDSKDISKYEMGQLCWQRTQALIESYLSKKIHDNESQVSIYNYHM